MLNNWKKYKLIDVINLIGGGTPKTSVKEYWDGDIPWLSVVDFNNGQKRVYDTEKKITELGLKNSSTKILKKGQLIISARGTVGVLSELGRDMSFNQSCYGLDAKKEFTTNDFLYYLVEHNIKQIKSNAYGSVFDTITTSTFENIDITLPSLPEQQAIAEILSSLDDKIELNLQTNKTLEEMANALYKHWFVDFGPFQNGKFIESELGLIPEGWEVTKISDLNLFITDFVSNGSFASLKENVKLIENRKDYALFVRNTDLKNNFTGDIKYVNKDSYEFLKKSKLFGEELIISNVGDVGSVYLCPKFKFPMTLGNNVIMIKSELYRYFLYMHFKGALGQHDIYGITGGSAQPKFNKTDFKNLSILQPKEKIILEFNSAFESIQDLIFEHIIENNHIQETRDYLLPKLISGEIRIKDIVKK